MPWSNRERIAASTGRTDRLALAYLAGCGAWLAVSTSGIVAGLSEYSFVVLAAATLLASAVGLRVNRPPLRWPWRALAASLVLFLIGGAVRQQVGSYGDLSASRSLVPDYIVLAGYALVAAALIGVVRARSGRHRRDLDVVLDSAVIALASLTIAWVYLITPALFSEPTALKVRLSLAVYPPLSVFMAAVTIRVSFAAGQRMSAAQRLLLAMMLFMVAGDVVATIGDAHLAAVPKTLADLPYALAFTALGATYLHPSMARLTDVVPSDEAAPTRRRLIPVVAALAVPAVVSQLRYRATTGERVVFGAIVVALTATALWRMARALHQQAALQLRLRYQATHDELTGLPNRSMLLEHLGRTIADCRVEQRAATALFIDLDRFKAVNDTSGHAVGDELLRAVALRLRAHLGPSSVVGRLGGDEFFAIVPADAATTLSLAEHVRLGFHEPFRVGELDLYSSVSIGLAHVGGEHGGEDAEAVMQNADTAMYQVKVAGGDGVALFDVPMRDQLRDRMELENELRHALARRELEVYYQPIVSLASATVDGFEALLRWKHHARGLVPPTVFIPIAESSGLIVGIGRWVVAEAARQLAGWLDTGRLAPGTYVAVNLSARQLRDPTLLEHVADALHHTGLAPASLCLELTESLLLEDPDAALGILHAIRGLGVRLSIDDFGTGYSSLSYLRRLPVDNVKIDKSFVDGLVDADGSDAALVSAIIAMADALDKTTIAEGVETERQAERLRALGAGKAQGYLYGRPTAADVVPALVANIHERALSGPAAEAPGAGAPAAGSTGRRGRPDATAAGSTGATGATGATDATVPAPVVRPSMRPVA